MEVGWLVFWDKLFSKVKKERWLLWPSSPGPSLGLSLLKHTNEFSCLLFVPDVIRCLEAALAWEEGWELPWLSKGSHADPLGFLQQQRRYKQVISAGKGDTPKECDFFSFYPARNHLSSAQSSVFFINSILSSTFFKARDKYSNWLDRIWLIETQETCTSFARAWNGSKGMQLSLAQYWPHGNNPWSEDMSWADRNINEFCLWLRNIDIGCHLRCWPWCFPTY